MKAMPTMNLVRSGWTRMAVTFGLRAFALLVIACTFAYVVHAAIPVVFSDGWWFSDTFVRRYVDGQLGIADFFRKRAEGFDHAQPLHRLLLLANVAWFDMDFMIEGAMGALFGLGLLLLLGALVARELRAMPGTWLTRELVFVGLTVCIFSFNERELFTFPLATFAFLYILGVTLYFVALRHCVANGRPFALFVATVASCLLLDTSAVLAAACGCALVAFITLRDRRIGVAARHIAAIVAGVLLYRFAYAFFLPMPDASPIGTIARVGRLIERADEAWKLLVIPSGDALIATSRVATQFGAPWVWPVAIPAALLVLAGHLWFWRRFAPHRDARLPFVAAGLMLFFYAVLAGIVWTRVADHGFDYLSQPRYLVFYALQPIAMLLLWAFLVAHARSPATGTATQARRPHTPVLAGVVVGLAALAVYFMSCVNYEMPFLRDYEYRMARLVVDFGRNPEVLPPACKTVIVEACDWPAQRRNSVIDVLQRAHLNVFSADFVQRHHWRRKFAEEMSSEEAP
jgi:hypothetical protein